MIDPHGWGAPLALYSLLLADGEIISVPGSLLVCGIGLIALAFTGLISAIWRRRDRDIDNQAHEHSRFKEHVQSEYVRKVEFRDVVAEMRAAQAEVTRVLFTKLDGMTDQMTRLGEAFARHEGEDIGARGKRGE